MDMLRRMFGLGPARRDAPPPQTMFTNEAGDVRVQMQFDQSGMGAMARHNFGMILGWDNVPANIGMVPVIEVKQDGKWQPVSGSTGPQPNLQTQMNFLQGWTETGIIGPQPVNEEGTMATQTELYEQAPATVEPTPPLALPPAYAPYNPLQPSANGTGPYSMGGPAVMLPSPIGPPNLGAVIQGPPQPKKGGTAGDGLPGPSADFFENLAKIYGLQNQPNPNGQPMFPAGNGVVALNPEWFMNAAPAQPGLVSPFGFGALPGIIPTPRR